MSAKQKPILGLLGAPGSGKSLVARQLEQLGCGIVDADRIAKTQLHDPQVIDTLRQWWGDSILDQSGMIDRAAVGAIVFQDPAQRDRLEALVHPRVAAERKQLEQHYQADSAIRAIVQDVPLLLEIGLDAHCDALVFVDADFDTRLKRVQQHRGWDTQELAKREKNQTPLDTKRSHADYVIHNNASEAECFDQVRRVFDQILHPTL